MRAVRNYRMDDLFVCTSERMFTIGALDGSFPNFGRHSAYEMGGIWCNNFKLADGFCLHIDGKPVSYTSYEVDSLYHRFRYAYKDDVIELVLFSPTIEAVLEITYHIQLSKACKVEFTLLSELIGAWLWEQEHERGEDMVHIEHEIVELSNTKNQFYGALACSQPAKISQANQVNFLNTKVGSGAYVRFDLEKTKAVSFTMLLSGSPTSVADARATLAAYDGELARSEKKQVLAKKMAESHLESSHDYLKELLNIGKLNTMWLTSEVEGIGRSVAAGYPDYPWFFGCDNTYLVPALLRIGEFELAKSTLRLIYQISKKVNGDGKIIHEISNSGIVYNDGNVQETPHFIIAVCEYVKWTGDFAFAQEVFAYCELGIERLLRLCDAGTLFPKGYGIMEIAGLDSKLIDSAVYTLKAVESMAQLSKVCKPEQVAYYQELFDQHLEDLDTHYYMEEAHIYADTRASAEALLAAFPTYYERQHQFVGDRNHRLNHLDQLQMKLRQEVDPTVEKAWSIFKNWVTLTPFEMNYAKPEIAETVLKQYLSGEFMGADGLYIEALGRNVMMSISTSVFAIALGNYGFLDEMLEVLKILHGNIGKATPLSIAELSPDKGCFVQAWTLVGATIPLVSILFGIQPNAIEGCITIEPKLANTLGDASLSKVRVGDGHVSVDFTQGKLTVENTSSYEIVVK